MPLLHVGSEGGVVLFSRALAIYEMLDASRLFNNVVYRMDDRVCAGLTFRLLIPEGRRSNDFASLL